MILPAGVRVAWRAIPPGADRRAVSRSLLAELLPGAEIVSRCPRCGGEHGRVQIRGAAVTASVSYGRGWTVVATLAGDGRVGVDAVAEGAVGLDRVLPEADARAWARVEAVLKADGRGLVVDPARVRISEAGDGTWTAAVDDGRSYVGYDLVGPPGVVAALAVLAGATCA